MNWYNNIYKESFVSRIICWIGPDGRVIPFPINQEARIIVQMGFSDEANAYKSKYAKVVGINGVFSVFVQYVKDGLTSAQREVIKNFILQNNFKYYSIADGINPVNIQKIANPNDFLKMIGIDSEGVVVNSTPQKMPPTPPVNNSQKVIKTV